MRQTTERTTVYRDDITEVIVEVRQEFETPILDALYKDWWEKNCEADFTDRELTNILGPNWKNER